MAKGYFNITLSAKESAVISYIYSLIFDYWSKHNNQEITSKVYAQKVIVDVIEKTQELNFITRGWFKFGKVVLLPPENIEPSLECKDFFCEINLDSKKLDETIIKSCEEFDSSKDIDYWKKLQYSKYENNFYMDSMELENGIKNSDSDIKTLIKLFYKFLKSFPEDNYIKTNCFNDTQAFVLLSESLLKRDSTERGREIINNSFKELWDLIAMCNLFSTVEGTQKDEVKTIIDLTLPAKKLDSQNNLLEIKSYLYSLIQLKNNKIKDTFMELRSKAN